MYAALGADLTDDSSRAAPVSVGVASTGDFYTAHGSVTEYWACGQAADCKASRRRLHRPGGGGPVTGLRSGLWSAGVRDSRVGAVAGRVGGRSAGVGGPAFEGAFLSPCGRHTFALSVPPSNTGFVRRSNMPRVRPSNGELWGGVRISVYGAVMVVIGCGRRCGRRSAWSRR